MGWALRGLCLVVAESVGQQAVRACGGAAGGLDVLEDGVGGLGGWRIFQRDWAVLDVCLLGGCQPPAGASCGHGCLALGLASMASSIALVPHLRHTPMLNASFPICLQRRGRVHAGVPWRRAGQ